MSPNLSCIMSMATSPIEIFSVADSGTKDSVEGFLDSINLFFLSFL